MQLSDTRAIITGGVSGLGLAVARHLVKHGGKVALFDVNDDKGAAAVAELGDGNARFYKTDVSDEAAVAANVAAAREFGGKPHPGRAVALRLQPRAADEQLLKALRRRLRPDLRHARVEPDQRLPLAHAVAVAHQHLAQHAAIGVADHAHARIDDHFAHPDHRFSPLQLGTLVRALAARSCLGPVVKVLVTATR